MRDRLLALTLLASSTSCAAKVPATLPAVAALAPPTAAARSWYLQSVFAEERGDLERAALAWAWVAREDPANPHAHAHHARFLQRQRRWAEAEAAWSKASARDRAWWEPYAALAALAGRGGDDIEERRLLAEAVARGADGAAVERLVELHERAGDRALANAALDVWLARDLPDVEERRRRGWTAARLGREAEALGDLRAAATPDDPAAARAFVTAAFAACRVDEALAWARGIAPEDRVAPEALAIAVRAGDLATIELHSGVDASLGPAPATRRPPGWARSTLALVDAPAAVRAADGWIELGFGPRGEAWLALLAADPATSGWVVAVRALRRAAADPPGEEPHRGPAGSAPTALTTPASQDPREVRPDLAELVVRAVGFVRRGDDPADTAVALGRLASPELVGRVLGRLDGPPGSSSVGLGTGEAIVGRTRVDDRPISDRSSAAGQLLLPIRAHAAWLDETEARTALGPAASARGIRDWAERSPEDPRLGPALVEVDPQWALTKLDRALSRDPCDPEALAARARLAPIAERPAWHARVHRADPLRPR